MRRGLDRCMNILDENIIKSQRQRLRSWRIPVQQIGHDIARKGLQDEEEKTPIEWREHIVSTADILRGKPRIKGTRIPVSLILGYLAAGQTAEEIMAELPDLRKEQIVACLDYARALAEFEVVV